MSEENNITISQEQSIPTVDITIGTNMFGRMSDIKNTPSHVLAEFVDNALQSYRNNRERLESATPCYKLEVNINFDWKEEDKSRSVIRIKDNAAGIDERQFMEAFKLANTPEDNTGLKEVGKGTWVKVRGAAVMDTFDKEVILSSIQGIMKIPSFARTRTDDAPVKRVELHLHTKMSDMDGVSECKDLVKRAYSWGMPAIAITDHGNIQAFPDAGHVREDLLKAENKRRKEAGESPVDSQDFFKVLYGVECYLVDDLARSVVPVPGEDMEAVLRDRPVVVFDLETTGFSPEKNRIIEFGAVKIADGKVADRFSQFVNPEEPIPFRIQKLTGISDSMVAGAKTIDLILPFFLRFCEGCILVGHNVAFDIGFVKANADRLGLPCSFTTVDTLGLARALLPGHARYTLDAVAKLLNVSLENHHRAVDDAACTADIYLKMIPMLAQQGAKSLREIDDFCAPTPETVKRLRTHHCILLAKNTTGRTNLYTMVSESHLTYFFKKPRIPKSLLMEHREGLLVGSACEAGEFFQAVARRRGRAELRRIGSFYDYFEIMPVANNAFMLENGMADVFYNRIIFDLLIFVIRQQFLQRHF